uniref:Uncharacterized protein n=1 Tax=Branchiostoma floridae TaxID=7739 RepID=C3XWW1_BRAFL|eukprot:XP_002611211.1 hypothetical protein BRAFLDRAFT_71171 [Branchiostoma floridae]
MGEGSKVSKKYYLYPENMGRKLRHLLMFLLIILKEPNMQVDGWFWGSTPKVDRSCAPSLRCDCALSPFCPCNNRGLTSIPQNLPTFIYWLDLTAGIALVGTVILTIWYKRRTKNPPSDPSSGPNSNIALSNLPATVVTSGHDQTEQGGTESNTNPVAAVLTSGHDQSAGALYMTPEDVLYEMPADVVPKRPTEETSLAPPKRKSRLIDKPNSLPSPRDDGDDDDCVYVQPDGAMYMTPEDVLYEMPANSHYKQPVGANENLHYYHPQTEAPTLPTDADGYMVIAPKHMKGQ